MTNALRTARRKVMAVLAAPMLLGTVSAAAPLGAAPVDGQLDHKQTFYTDPAKTVYAGTAYYYCDGHYVLKGYETEYFTITNFYPPCP